MYATTNSEEDLAETVSLYNAEQGSIFIETNIAWCYHQAPAVSTIVQIDIIR